MGQGYLFKYLCLDFLPLGPYFNWFWISFWRPSFFACHPPPPLLLLKNPGESGDCV